MTYVTSCVDQFIWSTVTNFHYLQPDTCFVYVLLCFYFYICIFPIFLRQPWFRGHKMYASNMKKELVTTISHYFKTFRFISQKNFNAFHLVLCLFQPTDKERRGKGKRKNEV